MLERALAAAARLDTPHLAADQLTPLARPTAQRERDRRHPHRIIDTSELPITDVTRRSGRRYVRVLHKTADEPQVHGPNERQCAMRAGRESRNEASRGSGGEAGARRAADEPQVHGPNERQCAMRAGRESRNEASRGSGGEGGIRTLVTVKP